jgi:5-azacytidine-induced protein 1
MLSCTIGVVAPSVAKAASMIDCGESRSIGGGSSFSTAVYDGVKTKLMNLTLESEDKGRTITALKSKINRMKVDFDEILKEKEVAMEQKYSTMKGSLEETVKRHLNFIDKLLVDKEELSKQCEKLVDELKSNERKHHEGLEGLETKYSKELKKAKDSWAAEEKARREKWEADKARSIKEMTIKGLEPEIQKIISNQKEEKKRLELRHKEVLSLDGLISILI